MKSKLVILDANVIIDMHRNGIWNKIISLYEIYVPATVAEEEAVYFLSKDGQQRQEIKINKDIEESKIKVLEASVNDSLELKKKVKEDYYNSIDPGELEAIALLHSGEYDDFKFCTGDKAAIRALTMFDLTFQGISLEELLSDVSIKFEGFSNNYSQKEFKKQQGLGMQEKDLHLK